MKVIPYLNFPGNAEKALHFYEHALNAEVSSLLRYGENPMPGLSEDTYQLIMHAELFFGDNKIYLSDIAETTPLICGDNFSVHLDCDTEEEIRQLFSRLSEHATSIDPLEDTFWGAIFGALTDQFGIQWSLNYQKPE